MTQATDIAGPAPARSGRADPNSILRFLPAFAAIVVTVWFFRRVMFQGQLPGNIGDARWTIAVHEHWYRVWAGQDSIRDLFYYYPLLNTLGTSDAFLGQGLVYSAARLLGFGLVNAWLAASIATFLIGALGVAALGRRVLDHAAAQVAFVLLSCASYAMFAAGGHPQLYGMLAVSWIFVGLYDLISQRRVRRGVALLAIVPPVLALSSWYPAMLTAMVLTFLALALALVSSGAGIRAAVVRVAWDLWSILRTATGVVLALFCVVLWAMVLWVYLPSRGLLPAPAWTEVALYSPQWSDIWNATWEGGGVWSVVYDRFPLLAQANSEVQYGFTPILFLAFVAAALGVLRASVLASVGAARSGRIEPPSSVGRLGVLAAAIAIAAMVAFFLVDERALGLYRIPWHLVPGLESIRAPFRVMAIVYGLALFVLLRSLELVWRAESWLDRVPWHRAAFAAAAGLLTIAIFVEMQRPLVADWTRADLLSTKLLEQVEPIKESGCEALIVLDSDPNAPWANSIDGVILSTITGIPTPQGHSRDDPIGYPNTRVPEYDPMQLVDWIRTQGVDGSICAVSAQGMTLIGS